MPMCGVGATFSGKAAVGFGAHNKSKTGSLGEPACLSDAGARYGVGAGVGAGAGVVAGAGAGASPGPTK